MPANITDVFFVNKVRITCSFDNEGARDIVIISVFGAYLDSRKFRKSYRYVRNGHGVYKYVYRVIFSRVSFVFRIVTRGTMFLIFHCIVLVYLNTIRNYFQVS